MHFSLRQSEFFSNLGAVQLYPKMAHGPPITHISEECHLFFAEKIRSVSGLLWRRYSADVSKMFGSPEPFPDTSFTIYPATIDDVRGFAYSQTKPHTTTSQGRNDNIGVYINRAKVCARRA